MCYHDTSERCRYNNILFFYSCAFCKLSFINKTAQKIERTSTILVTISLGKKNERILSKNSQHNLTNWEQNKLSNEFFFLSHELDDSALYHTKNTKLL